MKAHYSPSPYRRHQRGFTLVELMVAVLLGLLTVLVISQVLVQSEARRRTISSGGDAQLNGALALFTLQRDIQMAGYGTAAYLGSRGCMLSGQRGSKPIFTLPMAPVVIENGIDGAPDRITILQAQTRSIAVPIKVKEIHPKTGSTFIVESSIGVAVNDMMVAIPPTGVTPAACTLFQVTSDTSDPLITLGNNRIPHTSASDWNQDSVMPTEFPDKSRLINMGNPSLKTYAISNDFNLTLTERSWATGDDSTQDLFPQIVNMQALYGKDTNNDQMVDTYDETTPTTSDEWAQVLSIRVAVVARSIKDEGSNVTTSQPLWDLGPEDTVTGPDTSTCHGESKCITLSINKLPNWQRFRYKVYDTIIPLRNVVWNS